MIRKSARTSFYLLFSLILFVTFISYSIFDKSFVSAQKSISVSDVYIVIKGDTLWDISARFFGDPYLWPTLWQKNPHIKDPHWIFPGEIINLRDLSFAAYSKPLGIQPGQFQKKGSGAVPPKTLESDLPSDKTPAPQYITTQDIIDSCSYMIPKSILKIKQAEENWARIVDAKEDKINFSYLDYIYLDIGEKEAQPEQIFTIFKVEKKIKTPSNLALPYYMVRILGKAKVIEVYQKNSLARIFKSYAPITMNDFAKPYSAMPVPVLTPAKIDTINGRLIASDDANEYLSDYDIVFLNIGKRDGLEPGNPLEIYKIEKVLAETDSANTIKVTQKIGKLFILRVEDNTSTAQIVKSAEPITLGDYVRVTQE